MNAPNLFYGSYLQKVHIMQEGPTKFKSCCSIRVISPVSWVLSDGLLAICTECDILVHKSLYWEGVAEL